MTELDRRQMGDGKRLPGGGRHTLVAQGQVRMAMSVPGTRAHNRVAIKVVSEITKHKRVVINIAIRIVPKTQLRVYSQK